MKKKNSKNEWIITLKIEFTCTFFHFRPIVWAAEGEFVSKQAHRIFKSGQKSLTAEHETQKNVYEEGTNTFVAIPPKKFNHFE